MKGKFLAILGILALLVALLPAAVYAAPPPIDYRPVDVGPRIRGWEATPERIGNTLADAAAEVAVSVATPLSSCTLASKYFLILNDYTGQYQITTFDLVAESTGSQIWVQRNLAWPAGDPRPTPVITCEQAQYMMGQFDTNIYPKEASFFGTPDFHDGGNAFLPGLLGLPADYYYDAGGRQIVLVSNIRDNNYYDPAYPIYIAGFYSSSFEVYFDRNVMSIDAYDWANRTGPSGTRPYLYEGIFAHEYQHLLHDDYDSDEETFINEGMADLAMVLTGYGESVTGHLEDTADLPENSLVVWGDQGDLEILADYGNAFLFQYYLMEKFSPPFIQALFHNPLNGISGVNDTLAMFGSSMDFGDVFHNWAVAKLIDSKTPNDGYYQFKGLDFKLNIGTPDAPNPEAFSTPGAPPWGTDYIWIQGDPKNVAKLTFNGLDYSMFPTAWTVDNGMLWSGTGDLLDNWAIFETVGGGTLKFDTIWDLEDYWDFGFVQVSTDGGYTWVSLYDNEGYATTDHDPNAHPKVIANLPGLTSYITTPVTLTYDLSAYAGQNILVAFRLVTDWATYYGGWWIDNVYVDDTLISDGTDALVFKDITEILPTNNDFTVTFVGIKNTSKGNQYKVISIDLGEPSEDGFIALSSMLKWSQKAVMLVTFDAPEGFTNYADYSYDFVYKTGSPKK
ncbi:MAG: peptidase M6 [Bacteroidota bacterium]